jgi:hypothetical protein
MDVDGGIVSGRLTISGIVQWFFTYVSRDTTHPARGTSNAPVTFDIGAPDRLSHEIDSWSIAATNQAGSATQYSALLEWLQDEKVIATWRDPDSGTTTVQSGGVAASDGNALLVTP